MEKLVKRENRDRLLIPFSLSHPSTDFTENCAYRHSLTHTHTHTHTHTLHAYLVYFVYNCHSQCVLRGVYIVSADVHMGDNEYDVFRLLAEVCKFCLFCTNRAFIFA